VLDLYCPKLKLCIEVDGEQHLLTKEKDARRDAFMASYGVLTIRIPSLELFGENNMGTEAWAFQIKEICDARWRELYPDKEVPERKFSDG
jgi:very-short-patch-repair endonuclease